VALLWCWIFAEIVATGLGLVGLYTGIVILHRHRMAFSSFRIRDVMNVRVDAVMWIMVVGSTFGCIADLLLRWNFFSCVAWKSTTHEWRILFLVFVHSLIGIGAISWHVFADRMLQKQEFCYLCRKPL
jgi:hypothetical protein